MKELSLIKKNYIDYINKIIMNEKVSHSYLVEIGNYENDLDFIFDFIKMILINASYEEMLNSDNKIIKLIDNNNYPDIVVIEPEGNVIKKNQLLNLQKEFSNKSLLDNKRVYIIKDCEKLNVAAANTILKFLEEPEENIIAFLLTSNRYQVIETILSRCQIINLRDNPLFKYPDQDIISLIDAILHPNVFFEKYNYFISNIIVDKNVAREKFCYIENFFVDYLNNKYDVKLHFDEYLLKIFVNVTDAFLVNKISILEGEINKLEYNINYKLWLDCLFSKLLIGG